MENKYTVYCHTFPNGKMYFGQTCNDEKTRWKNGYGYMRQPLVWRAIQKYGWDNIEHRIISTGLDKEEADFQEMFYISAYRTNEREFGYNLTLGGEGSTGVNVTDETRKKLSESHRGRVFTEEHCRKISEANKGKHHSEETRKKLSESHKGHKSWTNGKHLSEETRKKISEANKGKTSPNKGNHISEETRKRMSDKAKGRPIQKWLTPDGSIREMNFSHVRQHHPDWVQIE